MIPNLATGIDVYVRVAAGNSQGYGLSTSSTPTYLRPTEASSEPNDVNVAITSSTMITVSFDEPTNLGGDSISFYKVEWDTASNFNGPYAGTAHKGSIERDASLHRSYTITGLSTGYSYFVRVFARNSGNVLSAPRTISTATTPSNREPGKPHTISVTTGSSTGEIEVSFNHPSIPWHGIPCAGLITAPDECPSENGVNTPSSNGGILITEYIINYNERADFLGLDSGEVVVTSNVHTLKNLIAGRIYYVRVMARNSQGSGQFCSFVDPNCNVPVTAASAMAAK